MTVTLVALTIILWAPAAIVIFYHLLWDVKLWESKEYSFRRLRIHFRGDYSLSHRKLYRTTIKAVLFILLSLFPNYPTSILPLLCMFLAYAIWSAEAIEVGEKILKGIVPRLVPSVRNFSILALGVLLILLLPLITNMPYITGQETLVDTTRSTGISELLPTEVGEGIVFIPAIYILLVLSTLLALAYDLGTPVVSSVLVFLTSPVYYIQKSLLVNRARVKLSAHPDMAIVAITGSTGKTTTKRLLEAILSEEYNTVTTPAAQTKVMGVADSIIRDVKPNTEVFITDMNSYGSGDIAEICGLIKPNIAVITGVDTSHAALFGSMERTLEAKTEIIEGLREGGTLVINGDDDLAVELAGRTQRKEIFYFLKHDPHRLLVDNDLEIDTYRITKTNSNGGGGKRSYVLENQSTRSSFQLPDSNQDVLHSVLASIVVARELGASLDTIFRVIHDNLQNVHTLETLEGDEDTTLLVDSSDQNLKSMENNLLELANTPAKDRYLVTGGIKELGKYKTDANKRLAKLMEGKVDVLITYDMDLLEEVERGNTHIDTAGVRTVDELLYQIRLRLEPEDVLLLAGELDVNIEAALRSEN